MSTPRYFYRPETGHELEHDPLNAIIAPRPIGWVSTKNAMGQVNLAPYSFFNAFNYRPPIIGLILESQLFYFRLNLTSAIVRPGV